MSDNKRIRVRLYGQHLAYIGYDLYLNFTHICKVIDYSSWLKERAYKDFNLYVTNDISIDKLKEVVKENYFEDIADWLREKMREEIYENKNKN